MPGVSPWNQRTLRLSLLNAFFHNQIQHMEKFLRRKVLHKDGIKKTFRRQLIKDHGLWDKSSSSSPSEGRIWNIVNGTWEPESRRSAMTVTHIVPEMLGNALMKKVLGSQHHPFHSIYGMRNALLLPSGVVSAMNDWAITIVPDISENPTLEERQKWAALELKEFKFRVLDPNHLDLRERISGMPEDTRLGRELDQQRLQFRDGNPLRPSTKYLYFNHRCAVMNRFHHLFYEGIPQEGLKSTTPQRRKKLLSMDTMSKQAGLLSRTEFWNNMVQELKAIDHDTALLLDWGMELEATESERSGSRLEL
ncbi:hypothetical protein BDP27DRAFT_1315044 [Rhodocollybia butyracea]|uniref:HNH nuclease domain-containing protein n=1 Tax=Rhodocollybia butyracea TaxID=206335 RepID=A0A9P5UEN0_9AGAR|nr:hypothetical protein BDP27DRAFT_1315044 [Rhodocollybia butyracea]